MTQDTNDPSPSLASPGTFQRIWKNPWLVFLLPFVVYMLVGSLEPSPETQGGAAVGLAIPYEYYPLIYTIKIALTMVAILLVCLGYRQFPLKVNGLAIVVGIVGVVLWIGITKLGLEHFIYQWRIWNAFGVDTDAFTQRSAFNPFAQYPSSPATAWCFLSIRFFGLAIVVPVIEEFFLRGFVMRFVMERDWWKVPFGNVTFMAVIAGTLVPMMMHPAELVAAAVWFSLVTWLMVRTRNIWDCVVAHMLTNGLLGIYVVISGDWYFM